MNMDFEKMKKEELLELVKQQQHLVSAVESKDAEIARFSNDNLVTKKRLEEAEAKLRDMKHLSEAVQAKDAEIIKLKDEINKSKASLAEGVKKAKDSVEEKLINRDLEIEDLKKKLSVIPEVDKLKSAIDTLSKENTVLVKVANAHLSAFRNLMKAIQGTLDNAIELEAVITESLQIQKGGNK
jgi:chromosome segregation ATPase